MSLAFRHSFERDQLAQSTQGQKREDRMNWRASCGPCRVDQQRSSAAEREVGHEHVTFCHAAARRAEVAQASSSIALRIIVPMRGLSNAPCSSLVETSTLNVITVI